METHSDDLTGAGRQDPLLPSHLAGTLATTAGATIRQATLEESLREKISQARRVLLVGVGGGNDSVSTLMVRAQLEKDFGLAPEAVAIAAMLPDVLEYRNLKPTLDPLVWQIEADAERWLGGNRLRAFPEPLLARDRQQFGLEAVYGIRMDEGSAGVERSLAALVKHGQFDLVLACDVGGDFVAAPENDQVLSPMMDGYALHAFRRAAPSLPPTNLIYCIFGLGTDGESSPAMLKLALNRLKETHEGTLESDRIKPIEDFYRQVIAPNRHSRTADFTLRLINGEDLQTVNFKARFHTQPSPGVVKSYYGEFEHVFAPEYSAKYYLFEDIGNVQNPFEVECKNGLEWFVKVHGGGIRYNHELAGQSYGSIEKLIGSAAGSGGHSILFATPSVKFSEDQRREIFADTLSALRSNVVDFALVFADDIDSFPMDGITLLPLNSHLSLLFAAGDQKLEMLATAFAGYVSGL